MNKFHRDIEKHALELRNKYNLNGYGIENIFSLVEKMDIFLIRYPLGQNSICGFCTIYEGKKIIVSNTDEILAREIFTIAHEIGHFEFDIDKYSNEIKIDKNIEDDKSDKIEERANLFAAAFLMPKSKLIDYIDYELTNSSDDLNSLDIVKMQNEFNVSYSALVCRLYDIGLISTTHKNKLFEERKEQTSRVLFDIIQADKKLLYPSKKIIVPQVYREFAVSNYQNGYITFEKMKEALMLINVDEMLIDTLNTKSEVYENDYEDDDLDDIDFEYFE